MSDYDFNYGYGYPAEEFWKLRQDSRYGLLLVYDIGGRG